MYVIIAGGGKVGEYLANIMLSSGNEVAIIEQDIDVADRLSMILQGRYLIIHGDGCDTRSQEDAGIRNADVFVATTGQDDNNLVSCEIASRIYGVPRSIARVNAPKNMRIFKALGIECISSTEMIAHLIEEETLLGVAHVATSLSHGNITLTEIDIGGFKNNDPEAGVAPEDIEMPPESIIVAISNGEYMEVVGEQSRIYPGDIVVIVSDRGAVMESKRILADL